jgi:colicin import membrane protein
MVTLSALAHVLLLGYAAVALHQPPRVIYRPPAYTVDLVDAPPVERPALAAAAQSAPARAPAGPAPTPPPAPLRSEMGRPERQQQAEAELERQKQAEAERQRQAELERQKQAERLAKLQERREQIRAEQARQARLAKIEEQREQIRKAATEAAEAQARAAEAARLSAQQLEIKFKEYYNLASQQIRAYWIVPEWVKRRDVDVIVSAKIGRDGRILSTTIEKQSGDARLDESVARALERARQEGLPPLPDEYPSGELDLGLIFNPSTQS